MKTILQTCLNNPRVRWGLGAMLVAFMALGAWGFVQSQTPDPEIALKIGEPWEDMRQRSTAKIDSAIPDGFGFLMPETHARLRFVDDQYGFVTPSARFFAVMFDDERVSSIRMSPQVEPLLMDDAMRVVQDLQAQWRRGGWEPIRKPIEDTPELRQRLKRYDTPSAESDWQAGENVQVMLLLHRFEDKRHLDQERYLITLSMAKPWIPRCPMNECK